MFLVEIMTFEYAEREEGMRDFPYCRKARALAVLPKPDFKFGRAPFFFAIKDTSRVHKRQYYFYIKMQDLGRYHLDKTP